jgi:hypothetical protein
MKLFNPVFIPHLNIHYSEVNSQYGITFNFMKEFLGHCLGLNIYFGKKIIHLGIKF